MIVSSSMQHGPINTLGVFDPHVMCELPCILHYCAALRLPESHTALHYAISSRGRRPNTMYRKIERKKRAEKQNKKNTSPNKASIHFTLGCSRDRLYYSSSTAAVVVATRHKAPLRRPRRTSTHTKHTQNTHTRTHVHTLKQVQSRRCVVLLSSPKRRTCN